MRDVKPRSDDVVAADKAEKTECINALPKRIASVFSAVQPL